MPDINIRGSSSKSPQTWGTGVTPGVTLVPMPGPSVNRPPSRAQQRPKHQQYGGFLPSRIDRRMGALLNVNNWLDADDWVIVKSSNIAAIRYNREHRILHVMFSSGTRYEYDMVPEHVAVQFFSAKSLGKFLHRRIKKRYNFRGPFPANTRTIQTIRESGSTK